MIRIVRSFNTHGGAVANYYFWSGPTCLVAHTMASPRAAEVSIDDSSLGIFHTDGIAVGGRI